MKNLWAGIGFQGGVTGTDLETALLNVLQAHALSAQALIGIASLDRKRNSQALQDLAQAWQLELQFFSSEELNSLWTPNPSQQAFIHVQARSVAEAAALWGAKSAQLIIPKQIYRTASQRAITLAISQVGADLPEIDCGKRVV